MANVAYIRVSTVDQNTARQLDGLQFDRIFEDKVSGSTTNRAGLNELRDYVREGDSVHVHDISRMARKKALDYEKIKASLAGGLSIRKTAIALDISVSSVQRVKRSMSPV